MTYATQQDMVDRFGETEIIQISDRAIPPVAIDTTVVALKLADADEEINSYLVTRYTLPLASVPPVLTRVACDIARYHLYDDRPNEAVKERYNAVIAFLTQLAKGEVSLGPGAGGTTPPSSDLPEYCARPPVFNACTLKDYTR